MATKKRGGTSKSRKQTQRTKSKSKDILGELVDESQSKSQPSKSIFTRDNRLSSLFSSQGGSQSTKQASISSDDDLFIRRDVSPLPKKRKLNTPITQFSDNDIQYNFSDSSDDIFKAQVSKKQPKKKSRKQDNQLRSPLGENEQELEPFRKLNKEIHHSQSQSKNESQSRSQSRRSSYYNRGRRVSSIGGFDGEPHQEVPSTSYHKYIDNSVPESDRMRQLLIWNLKAELDIYEKEMKNEQADFRIEDHTVFNIARTIKEELISSLKDYSISIDWKDTNINNSDILLPNPQNQTNLENIRIYSEKIEELKREKLEWEEAFKNQSLPMNKLNIIPTDEVQVKEFSNYVEETYNITYDNLKNTIPCVDKLYFTGYQMEQATKLIESERDLMNKKVSNYINNLTIPPKEPSSTKNLLKAICKLKAQ